MVIGALGGFVLHARDASAVQEREAQVVARTDADAESVTVARNRTIASYCPEDAWLGGAGLLDPAAALRQQLDEQLASTNAAQRRAAGV